MYLRKHRRHAHPSPINLAAMVDVVFLLIIFFMTVSQITRIEAEALTLPEATQGMQTKAMADARMVVNVDTKGRLIVLGAMHTVDALKQLLATHKRTAGEKVSVLIRSDQATPWHWVADVMNACAENGIVKVRVAVLDADSVKGQ